MELKGLKLQLTNIYNDRRKIYLFTRDNKGKQKVIEDNSFYPYFYEPSPDGRFLSYNNIPLKKVLCHEPGEVAKIRSKHSFESDIIFTRRYILDKIDKIEKFNYFSIYCLICYFVAVFIFIN